MTRPRPKRPPVFRNGKLDPKRLLHDPAYREQVAQYFAVLRRSRERAAAAEKAKPAKGADKDKPASRGAAPKPGKRPRE